MPSEFNARLGCRLSPQDCFAIKLAVDLPTLSRQRHLAECDVHVRVEPLVAPDDCGIPWLKGADVHVRLTPHTATMCWVFESPDTATVAPNATTNGGVSLVLEACGAFQEYVYYLSALTTYWRPFQALLERPIGAWFESGEVWTDSAARSPLPKDGDYSGHFRCVGEKRRVSERESLFINETDVERLAGWESPENYWAMWMIGFDNSQVVSPWSLRDAILYLETSIEVAVCRTQGWQPDDPYRPDRIQCVGAGIGATAFAEVEALYLTRNLVIHRGLNRYQALNGQSWPEARRRSGDDELTPKHCRRMSDAVFDALKWLETNRSTVPRPRGISARHPQ